MRSQSARGETSRNTPRGCIATPSMRPASNLSATYRSPLSLSLSLSLFLSLSSAVLKFPRRAPERNLPLVHAETSLSRPSPFPRGGIISRSNGRLSRRRDAPPHASAHARRTDERRIVHDAARCVNARDRSRPATGEEGGRGWRRRRRRRRGARYNTIIGLYHLSLIASH